MITCGACGAEGGTAGRFCATCGERLSAGSAMSARVGAPTRPAPAARPPREHPEWPARALALLLAALLVGGSVRFAVDQFGAPDVAPRVVAAGAAATARATAPPTVAPTSPPGPRAALQARPDTGGAPVAPAAARTPPTASPPPAIPTAVPAAPRLPAATLAPLLRALPDRSSTACVDLDDPAAAATGDSAVVMPAGALIMLPIAGAAYERVAAGRWRLDEPFTLTAAQIVGGTGSLQGRSPGTVVTLDELVALMLTTADNTAANVVLAGLGGPAAVNAFGVRHGLGGTVVRRSLYDLAARDQGVENTTTAGDMARLLLLLDRGQVANPALAQHLLGHLNARALRDPAWLFSDLPPGAGVAHLTGQWPDFRGDAGIVRVGARRYALVLLVQGAEEGEMERAITRVAAGIYRAALAR